MLCHVLGKDVVMRCSTVTHAVISADRLATSRAVVATTRVLGVTG